MGQKMQFSARIVHRYAWVSIDTVVSKLESFPPQRCRFGACFVAYNKFIIIAYKLFKIIITN